MRGVSIDWLVEVLKEYNLLPESLYLTISYIDRYLSLNVLNIQRSRLLGVSSMLIDSPPHTEDFCDITDNMYTKQEVVKMEAKNSALEQLSGHKPSDLKECVQILHDLQSSKRAGNLVAIKEIQRTKEDLHEASSDNEEDLYDDSSNQEESYDEDSSDLEEYLGLFDETYQEDLGEDDTNQDDSDDGWV
uniref:G2/mitotic-specific cyclin C13-1-like n=1 Tax=Tanacetum cinerariifolium TaxID=118510 RepID=A0A6L2KB94_TANCI|nr:G2/mitotic-specific cyclin C13-1-like [Tanacetum cinerariifolium]